MWKYLDLLTKTSVQIEDLYLNLLDVLNLERPNKYTIFRAAHWQSYRNVILSDSIIRQIVDTVDEWRDSGYAQNDPGRWLDKIRYMRRNLPQATQSYLDFYDQNERSEMIEHACENVIHPIKMQEYDLIE